LPENRGWDKREPAGMASWTVSAMQVHRLQGTGHLFQAYLFTQIMLANNTFRCACWVDKGGATGFSPNLTDGWHSFRSFRRVLFTTKEDKQKKSCRLNTFHCGSGVAWGPAGGLGTESSESQQVTLPGFSRSIAARFAGNFAGTATSLKGPGGGRLFKASLIALVLFYQQFEH